MLSQFLNLPVRHLVRYVALVPGISRLISTSAAHVDVRFCGLVVVENRSTISPNSADFNRGIKRLCPVARNMVQNLILAAFLLPVQPQIGKTGPAWLVWCIVCRHVPSLLEGFAMYHLHISLIAARMGLARLSWRVSCIQALIHDTTPQRDTSAPQRVLNKEDITNTSTLTA